MTNNSVSSESKISINNIPQSGSSVVYKIENQNHNRAKSLKNSLYVGIIERGSVKGGQSNSYEDKLDFLEYLKILRSLVDQRYSNEIGNILDSIYLFRKLVFQLQHEYSDVLYWKTLSQQAIFINKLYEFFQKYAKENNINEDFDYYMESVFDSFKMFDRFNGVLQKGIMRCSELMQMYLPQESYEAFCEDIIKSSNSYSK